MYRPIKTKPARSGPPPLARASAGIFAALARKTKFVDPALAEKWPILAGEEIAAVSRPGRIIGQGRGKTLEVHVRDGAAAAEVQMFSDELIRRLNSYLGPRAITRLAVRQSGGRRPGPKSAAAGAPEDDSPLGAALSSFRAAIKRRSPDK